FPVTASPFVVSTQQVTDTGGPSEPFQVVCPPPAVPWGSLRIICDPYEAARAEWESRADPDRMLGIVGGQTSDRKLRLFACACCRRFFDRLDLEGDQRAVQVGELIADGEANRQELAAAHLLRYDLDLGEADAYKAARQAISVAAACAVNRLRPGRAAGERGMRAVAEERRALCDLLRDILG